MGIEGEILPYLPLISATHVAMRYNDNTLEVPPRRRPDTSGPATEPKPRPT